MGTTSVVPGDVVVADAAGAVLLAVGIASSTDVSSLLVPSDALLAVCGTLLETVVDTFPAGDLLLGIVCGLLVAVVDVIGEGLGLVFQTTGTTLDTGENTPRSF